MLHAVKGVFLSLLILVLSAGFSRAQVPELVNDPEFKQVAQAAVDSIYNFSFDEADRLLQPWKDRYPDHPLWLLMDGMTFWWHVLSDLTDTSHDEQFFYMMKKADYEASRLLRKNRTHTDALIIKAVANGYIARQYANRDEWLTSLNHARKAMTAHRFLLEQQPDMADLKFAEGLKYYYSAYLPEAYPIVKTVSWFMPDGDKKQGLDLLEEAADKAIFARAEATYFMGNINYNYEDNYPEAARHFEKLYGKYPHNNYYVRLLVKSYYRMKRYDDALRVINESLQRWQEKGLPYKEVVSEELLTWKGRILSRKAKYKEAVASYQKAFELGELLPRTRYRPYHVVAGYQLGKWHCANSNFAMAEKYLTSVTSSKADVGYKPLAEKKLSECRE